MITSGIFFKNFKIQKKSLKIKTKIISQIKINIKTYTKKNIPNNLKKIPEISTIYTFEN